MIKLYGIKNCDSVKKAQNFLRVAEIEFEFIDFRETSISAATLQSFVDALGWEVLINKRSTTYRNLNNDEKQNINIELTLQNLTLIKRPVLVNGKDISVGFSETIYAKL